MSTVNSEGTIPITEIYLKLTIKVEADDKSFLRDHLRISLPIFKEFK